MSYNLLFYRNGCEHCKRLKDYLNKRDSKVVKDAIKFVGPKYHKQFDVEEVPTLILVESKERLVGKEVFDWLRQELIENGIDPDTIFTDHPTGYWEGNQKFILAMFVLAGAVKYVRC